MGGFKLRETMYTNLRIHFVHHHVMDTVVILEEGNRPCPRSLACDMFVSWVELTLSHP